MNIEAEVEEILQSLEREEGHSFEILPQHHLEGASGKDWRIDFAIKDFNKVKYLVECKDPYTKLKVTFEARMSKAYVELCDLLLKLNDDFSHPRVRGIVVVRDISYIEEFDADEFDKWANLFHPINTQFFTLDMLDFFKHELLD